MKFPTFAPLPFAAAVLFTVAQAFPQQTQPPVSTRYSSALYLKVNPDKDAAFVENFKTGIGSKGMRGMMKANPKLLSYSLRRAVYGGYPLPEANFVLLTNMDGPPGELDTAKRDAVYREATGVSYGDYIQKVRAMSEVVGSTLSHVHHVTADYQPADGDVIISRRLKIAEGKNTDFNNLYRDVRFPMAGERVKAGNLKGWAYSHLSFPSGSSLPWDATETSYYKTMADAMPGPTATGGGGGGGGGVGLGGMTLFTKLFPNRSFLRYQDDLRDFSKVVRVDVYRVVSTIRP